jgi:hypothetical protein
VFYFNNLKNEFAQSCQIGLTANILNWLPWLRMESSSTFIWTRCSTFGFLQDGYFLNNWEYYLLQRHYIGQAATAVTLYTFTADDCFEFRPGFWGSWLWRFVILLSHYRKIPRYHPDEATTASFRILPNSLHIIILIIDDLLSRKWDRRKTSYKRKEEHSARGA